MAKTLKVGIIGVGGIAHSHLPGWEASPHAELVAGSDVHEPTLKTWGAQQKIKKLVKDPADLFSDPDIDIIDICTPNAYHAPLAIAAMEAGKDVICEKPLAPRPNEIRRMIEARDRTGKMLMAAQHFRFHGTSKALKAEIDTGRMGRIYHARSWMLRRAFLVTRPTFCLKAHSGGGACIDIGVHILDLTLWMMGNPKAVTVSGSTGAELAHKPGAFVPGQGPVGKDFDVEEFATAFVRFENGATLVFEVSWLLHHDIQGEDMQLWLYGTESGGHWPSCQILSTNLQTRQFYNETLKLTADTMEPHALECVEFAESVSEGRPCPVPAEHSLQVLTILDAIYESQSKGGEVRLGG